MEDVKKKFDTVIEGIHMVRETLERHKEENQREHEEFKKMILGVQAEVSRLHFYNTFSGRKLKAFIWFL